jgi:hypothetical protein
MAAATARVALARMIDPAGFLARKEEGDLPPIGTFAAVGCPRCVSGIRAA